MPSGSGTELAARARWLGARAFEVKAGAHELLVDSRGKRGPAAMEAVLGALTACLGSMVAEILDVMRVPFRGLVVEARGTEAPEAPRIFRSVHVRVALGCEDRERAERAVLLAESKYCPVSAILRGSGCELRVRADIGARSRRPAARKD